MTATELGLWKKLAKDGGYQKLDSFKPQVKSLPKATRCKETECNKYALQPSGLCKPHFFDRRTR